MIPRAAEVTPQLPAAAPSCTLPSSEEVTEEGFGAFRGTWYMGRVLVAEAEKVIREEAEILEWLDEVASTAEEFEVIARAIEMQETADVAADLGVEAPPAGLERFATDGGDVFPLGGLEVGVAGLCHALSVVGCLTAASCRSHAGDHSWSDAPIVLFRAPTWRVERLMEPVASERCGLGEDRGMLTIYAASVRALHSLAERLLEERGRFRRKPAHLRPRRRPTTRSEQLRLEVDAS